MKVAVITLKDSPNYGGILQAYALQEVVKKLGHDCVLIDYMNNEFRHKFTFFGKPSGMSMVYWLYKKVQYPLMTVMMRRMMPFYNRMNLTRHFQEAAELVELNGKYDVFITGSDQVWACDLNNYDDSYFLSFVDKNHRKIAYAASFGRTSDMLKDVEKNFIAPRLGLFDRIGVRERSGTEVIKSLSGRDDAVEVLDPTLLLDKSDWEHLVDHKHKGKGKKYILCYLMQSRINDREALKYAKELSRNTGMPVVKICRGLTSVIWGEALYIPTVEQWLGLFLDAEYIITNSFHGVAFSINFEKSFTAFLEGNPASGRNSRIYDRCKDFGLLDRIQVVGSKKKTQAKQIEYSRVRPIIQKRKIESINILRSAIEN
ncbi:MAG: polysaccharide pyruvyl transferase family protein [Turicibacter sp.]|nr:polysaccharide pyruvyl transferase family protein [Turicibacter sp.]